MTVSFILISQIAVEIIFIAEISRVMWTRGKARADRWTEEVVILLEEMRRTLAYCDWKASWRREQGKSRFGSEELHVGTSAYAFKQSDMWNSLR